MLRKILSLFTCSVLAFALTACGSKSPEATAEKFITAAYRGDADTVIALTYIEQVPGMEDMVRGKLKMMVSESQSKANELGGIKKVSAAPAKYSEDKTRADVKVTIIFKKDNFEKNEDLSLVKINDQWKFAFH